MCRLCADVRDVTFARRWTEPIILLLIIFNAVLLTIQSHTSAALDVDDNGNTPHPLYLRGYFHQWEDYALFALFCFFT